MLLEGYTVALILLSLLPYSVQILPASKDVNPEPVPPPTE